MEPCGCSRVTSVLRRSSDQPPVALRLGACTRESRRALDRITPHKAPASKVSLNNLPPGFGSARPTHRCHALSQHLRCTLRRPRTGRQRSPSGTRCRGHFRHPNTFPAGRDQTDSRCMHRHQMRQDAFVRCSTGKAAYSISEHSRRCGRAPVPRRGRAEGPDDQRLVYTLSTYHIYE